MAASSVSRSGLQGTRYSNERASILLVALWAVFLLTTFAVIIGSEVRQKVMLVKRLEERDTARLAAEAGVRAGIAAVQRSADNTYFALGQAWSDDPAAFKEVKVGDGAFTVSYALEAPNVRELTETRYGMRDEESKININKADLATMTRLFQAAGIDQIEAQDLASAIIDWRDADSELTTPGSAEDSAYRILPAPYEAKDAPFETLDEVVLVKGMDENLFKKMEKYITIYGTGRVNINTAPKAVLIAAGFSESLADKVIVLRNGKDGVAGTSDDSVFDDVGAITEKLTAAYSLDGPELAQLNILTGTGICTVMSSYFTVCVTGRLQRAKAGTDVSCVIDEKGRIRSWNEL